MDRTLALAPFWGRVWARRRALIALVVVATVVTGAIAFLLPPWYQGKVELLPPSEEESGFSIANLLRGVGIPGAKIPTEVEPAEVFIVILKSRTINEQMVERFQLKKLYKQRFMQDAIKELLSHTRFELTAAGTIRISVEDKDRQRAAEMANAYVEFLDRFNREVRMTKGRRARLFIEGRLAETRQELKKAEEQLADFQAKNKAVALMPQMSSAVQQAAGLSAQRMALQVRLGVVRSYSEGSEEEIQLRQELAQIDQQMRALPEMGIELARLVRDVLSLQQVLTLLTAQYEDARITEARDVVTIDVLDAATPPERKSRPRRGIMMAAAFLLSLGLGVGYAIFQEDEGDRRMMRAVAPD